MSIAETILITGANRGIGLELVRQLTAPHSVSKTVFAVCRNPHEAPELQKLAKERSTIKVLELKDVRKYQDYANLTKQVDAVVEERGLNLLINNAGVSPRGQSLEELTPEQMTETFEINSVAPLMLTKAFLPLLERAAAGNKSKPLSCARSAVINVTSQMGSIADNGSGSFYAYRSSKAALNIITKSLSIDLNPSGILVTCLHPGWVQTDMGGKRAPMKLEDCGKRILQTLSKLGEKENGAFVNYDNKTLPW